MKYFPTLLVYTTLMILGLSGTAQAKDDKEVSVSSPRSRLPGAFFIKTGVAKQTGAVSAGVVWDKSDWLFPPLSDYLNLSIDLEIGRWQSFHLDHVQAEFTQFGLTPMLRLPLSTSDHCQWFAEGGIGLHFIVPLYHVQEKKFSTSFNFQDLIGVGARLGHDRRHELVLYVSHFSNADINRPNPGENFLQLRYLRHFD